MEWLDADPAEEKTTGGEQGATPCPWCGAAVTVSRQGFPGGGESGSVLRCLCGAVGMQTVEPEVDRFRITEEILGVSRRLWADPAWGLENVEWRIVQRWNRLRRLEELVSGQEVWVALLWGRRKWVGRGERE